MRPVLVCLERAKLNLTRYVPTVNGRGFISVERWTAADLEEFDHCITKTTVENARLGVM